jgi:hypothetical protein
VEPVKAAAVLAAELPPRTEMPIPAGGRETVPAVPGKAHAGRGAMPVQANVAYGRTSPIQFHPSPESHRLTVLRQIKRAEPLLEERNDGLFIAEGESYP